MSNWMGKIPPSYNPNPKLRTTGNHWFLREEESVFYRGKPSDRLSNRKSLAINTYPKHTQMRSTKSAQ